MPRPEATASTFVIVPILKGVPGWLESHREALKMELGANPTQGARAAVLAVELDEAEQEWLRERKEGQDVTLRRDAWVERVRLFGGAVKAALVLRLDQQAERARLLSAFQAGAPSRVRSSLDGKRLLSHFKAQLGTKRALLDSVGEPITGAWLATIEGLLGELEQINADQGREKQERDEAKVRRDDLKAEALGLLRTLDLASRAASWVNPQPARALSALFDAFNPDGRASAADDFDDLDEPTPDADPSP